MEQRYNCNVLFELKLKRVRFYFTNLIGNKHRKLISKIHVSTTAEKNKKGRNSAMRNEMNLVCRARIVTLLNSEAVELSAGQCQTQTTRSSVCLQKATFS